MKQLYVGKSLKRFITLVGILLLGMFLISCKDKTPDDPIDPPIDPPITNDTQSLQMSITIYLFIKKDWNNSL